MLITLGQTFHQGDRVSPGSLNDLVDTATVSQFVVTDFSSAISFPSYGSTRPGISLAALHYDTTPGLEGLVYAWKTPSNASLSDWLYAFPRRECYCWANSAISAGTPVFIGRPHPAGVEFNVYDGAILPFVWQYSANSGPDAAFFITLESVTFNKPVKCMWSGLVPDTLPLLRSALSGASIASPLFVNYALPGELLAGLPTSRNIVFGVNTLNSTTARGALIWGGGGVIEDLTV
jgi:hypothetical protein